MKLLIEGCDDNSKILGFGKKDQRDALNEFLLKNSDFHVATLIDDGENFFTIENRWCLVNRIGFYLCNGDKDQTLILEELEENYE